MCVVLEEAHIRKRCTEFIQNHLNEEVRKVYSGANAVNEEGPERDRATQV